MIDRTLKVEGDMLTGLLVIADKPNAHGIVYPREVMEKMVDELKKNLSKKELLVYPRNQEEISLKRNSADAVGFVVDLNILENGDCEAQIKITNKEFLTNEKQYDEKLYFEHANKE